MYDNPTPYHRRRERVMQEIDSAMKKRDERRKRLSLAQQEADALASQREYLAGKGVGLAEIDGAIEHRAAVVASFAGELEVEDHRLDAGVHRLEDLQTEINEKG
jgi:hypothetical protein